MNHPDNHHSVLIVTGPTASGKSALAHALAERSGAEIISADSRQIYRELDIGTAKPSEEMLDEVNYHFINEKNIEEEYNAGDFAFEAFDRIRTIIESDRQAVVVGGSTLYIQGLLEGFSDLPERDPQIRSQLTDELASHGPDALYRRLESIDPQHAATLDPTKTQRLIRSLEIITITGKTVTLLHQTKHRRAQNIHFRPIALDLPRQELYRRIEQRTETMMETGLLEEAERLFKRYRALMAHSRINALETVGYKELFQYLDKKITLETAIMLIKQHTRNYAKRQLTFFKNRLNVDWMAAPSDKISTERRIEELIKTMH